MSFLLKKLLNPRHIAVFGGSWAEQVILNCQKMGFQGNIWPVHPKKDLIAGLKCYPDIRSLPDSPDLSYLAINRHATIEALKELSARRAGGAICFASGFSETGNDALQQELISSAGNMPILGPNCYGFLNYFDRFTVWPDQHGGKPVKKGVAIFSQSSNIAINLSMQQRGLPIGLIACLGNQAMISLEDFAEEALQDDRVTALGFYIEGISEAQKFAKLVYKAHQRNKAVVVIKSGLSPTGQQATASHTASIAGEKSTTIAFFQQCGVILADDLEEFLEILKLAHIYGSRISAKSFCSMSCSGGEAALMADLFDHYNLPAPKPRDETSQKLQSILGDLVSINNPLDYHTFIWGNNNKISDVFLTLMQDYDVGFFVIDFPRLDYCERETFFPAIEALVQAKNVCDKPLIVVASLSENIDERLAEDFIEKGIIPLLGLKNAIKASIKFFMRPQPRQEWLPYLCIKPLQKVHAQQEDQAKKILSLHQIRIPKSLFAKTLEQAKKSSQNLTPPFALKGQGFSHKTEAGAVRLNLNTLQNQSEIHGATGYLVEEMVTGTIAELLFSLKRDPVYGISLVLAQGGIFSELYAESQTLILPVSDQNILQALNTLTLGKILQGYRNLPKAHIDDLISQIRNIICAFEKHPSWHELEINPILITPEKSYVVDALIYTYENNSEDT